MTEIKIASWNVASLAACAKKGLYDFLKLHDPDILCVQETKLKEKNYKIVNYPHQYFALGGPHSGTAIFSKLKPEQVEIPKDKEGRIISLEFPDFILIACYTPNSGQELKRLEFRKLWDKEMRNFIKKDKFVVYCGDLNVSHKEIDLARPKTNHKTAGFTREERDGFQDYIDDGWVDCWRHFHPDKSEYTYFSYRFQCKPKNIGWRLDYFLVLKEHLEKIKSCEIHDHAGSDHLPLICTLKL